MKTPSHKNKITKKKTPPHGKTSHYNKATGRKYKNEYESRSNSLKQRADRNRARNLIIKSGKAKVGDKTDIAHKDNNTKNNKRSNLKVQRRNKTLAFPNRGFPRTSTGARKT